jgi:hypothetical protein
MPSKRAAAAMPRDVGPQLAKIPGLEKRIKTLEAKVTQLEKALHLNELPQSDIQE